MSQRFETPTQRAERRKRNRTAESRGVPLLNLSKRAMRRLGHTKTYRSVETHADGEQHVVARGRFDMGFHDRSRYAP